MPFPSSVLGELKERRKGEASVGFSFFFFFFTMKRN